MKDNGGTGPLGGASLWLGAALFVALTLAALWAVTTYLGQGAPALDPRLFAPQAIGLIALFLAAYFLADGLRLHFVLRSLGAEVTFRQILPLVFINIFFSNITPMATGGGFAQVWYLQRRGVPVGLSAAATTIRTILAMLAIFAAAPLFLLAGSAVEIGGGAGTLIRSIGLAILLYLAGFLVLLLRPEWLVRLFEGLLALLVRARLLRPGRQKLWAAAARRESVTFADGFRQFLVGPPLLSLGAAAATLVFLLTLFALPALLMQLLGQTPDWLAVIGTLSVVTFLMYFAPTPGGAGFSELAFAGLMAGRIEPAQLVTVIFVWRFLTIYLGMGIGAAISVIALRPGARRA